MSDEIRFITSKIKIKPPDIGRLGPPENVRPGGAHENTPKKREDKKLKKKLRQHDFEDL